MSWFTREANNYTNAIARILATLLWFIVGISCILGIKTQYTTFTAGWLMWIFIAIGVIEAIISFVTILDIITARKEETHARLDLIDLRRLN